MQLTLNSKDYVEYISIAASKINENKEYITKLDADTGDGDHWVNMNMGFEKLKEMHSELSALSLSEMFKKIAMTLMSIIGGSSGVLYGTAYLKAAKILEGVESISVLVLKDMLSAKLVGIMERGNSKPGDKTMIDPLYRAVEYMSKAISSGASEKDIMQSMKKGAEYGMNETLLMKAVKGRACYQKDKGVGKLDPGAVTMFYQIEALADYMINKKIYGDVCE